MNEYVIYLTPALGVLGLIVMAFKSAWVSKQDAGNETMQELARHIADGAMAFLKAEWKVLSIFVLLTMAFLAYSGTIHSINGKAIHSHWVISIAFLIGAVFSATAGYIGMKVATKANVRTTQAARTSLKHALASRALRSLVSVDCLSYSFQCLRISERTRSKPRSKY